MELWLTSALEGSRWHRTVADLSTGGLYMAWNCGLTSALEGGRWHGTVRVRIGAAHGSTLFLKYLNPLVLLSKVNNCHDLCLRHE